MQTSIKTKINQVVQPFQECAMRNLSVSARQIECHYGFSCALYKGGVESLMENMNYKNIWFCSEPFYTDIIMQTSIKTKINQVVQPFQECAMRNLSVSARQIECHYGFSCALYKGGVESLMENMNYKNICFFSFFF